MGFGDASGRVAEHTGDDEGLFARGYRGGLAGNRGVDHAADCGGGVGKNYARDAIDPRDIHDGRHHGDIASADVRRGLTAREG